MKYAWLFGALLAPFLAYSQCTTTNATSCVCADGMSTDCDLLPDITISWFALEDYLSGPTEYSQTGNGANDGRLRITGSTPNIGFGSFTVRGEDNAGTQYFVCGNDTTNFDPGICPDGNSPKQLIMQRIYHKNGNAMSYTDRWAGQMTYHPTHGHNHVDDWAYLTLRLEDPAEPDPRNWPIVGYGAKLGFCLMDYGTCPYYDGHCRDNNTVYQQGTVLNTAGQFPNYGLGGGAYNCSPVEQGISVGYTDIYSENLDGMWINIPPGTCNGNYWIVAEADIHDHFLESDETNNYTAIPFTLTQQVSSNPAAAISSDHGNAICSGESVTLTATTGLSYLWSTGETTQSITVSGAGTYTCDVTMYCGTPTASFTLTVDPTASAPVVNDTTICTGQSVTLSATGNSVHWFNSSMIEVGTGNTYTTPSLTANSVFYAQDYSSVPAISSQVGPTNNLIGTGGYLATTTNPAYIYFDVMNPIVINSVKVYSDSAMNRTLMILDNGGNMVQGGTFFIDEGEQIVPVNFSVQPGNDYEFRVGAGNGPYYLYRNSGGAAFPYTDGTGSVSITGTTASANNHFYWFYDWQISVEGSICPGPPAPVNVTVDACLGIDENADILSRMNIYPNPNDGIFTFNIDMPGTAGFIFSVTDVFGKNIFSKSVEKITGFYSENIDLSNVSSGIYFGTLTIDGKNYVKKISID